MHSSNATIKSADGIDLYYETHKGKSTKPTLFFLHGMGGDLDAWQYVKKPFEEKGYSTISMDLRGHGYSTHPTKNQSYEIDNFVRDILDILNKEKVEKVILIGHCYGAIIALALAAGFGEKLKGLILISGSYHPPLYLNSKAKQKLATAFSKALAAISPKPFKPGHSIYPPGKFHKDYEWWGLIKTIFHNSLKSYMLASNQIVNLNLEDKLTKIKNPTLILCGTKDSIFPLSISQNMHALIPDAKLEIIEDGNHVIILNNVKAVETAISRFLQTL